MKVNKTENSWMDMPKLESPFVRKEINGIYVVTPEINPGYEWVFTEPAVKAVEKMDGTNVSIVIKNGKVTRMFNRTNELDMFTDARITEALLHAKERGYIPKEDGQYFGEALGVGIQANPLNFRERLWIPFVKAEQSLSYNSWYKHERTFDNLSSWFKDYLFSLAQKKYGIEGDTQRFAEGVVFYHPDGIRMAKLRRDMFDWYEGVRH